MCIVWFNMLLKGLQMSGNKQGESNRTFEPEFQKQLLVWYTPIFSELSWDDKK